MHFLQILACSALLVAGALAVPSARSTAKTDFDGGRDVILSLYTQKNREEAEYIKIDDEASSPSFNPRKPTRFLIHGGGTSTEVNIEGRDAYFGTGKEYNVVVVDWRSQVGSDHFLTSNNSILVGDYVGKVIKHMIETRGLNPDTLSIVGHSMGGHVAAIAGNRAGGDKVVAEVVALDPAYELFDHQPLENQLDKTDAKFVQVIHTEGGGKGILDAGRGDVDFFPNGGSVQPGCADGSSCSHGRAATLFWESIPSRDFVAAKCASYEEYLQGACSANEHIPMGEWTPLTTSGTYYLLTNGESPYALGQTDL